MDISMIYTKVIIVDVICNFTVNKYFIWKHVESQMFISKTLKFWYSGFWIFQAILDGDTPFIQIVELDKLKLLSFKII